jgi:hypothetical protein
VKTAVEDLANALTKYATYLGKKNAEVSQNHLRKAQVSLNCALIISLEFLFHIIIL